MNENFEEKTLDVSAQSCDTYVFTSEYFKANVCNDAIKRLNEMINNLLTKIAPNDINRLICANSLMSTINTLYCLEIISYDKVKDYIKRLFLEGVK